MRKLTRDQQPDFEARLARLSADSVRRWGTLTVGGMLAHLRRAFEVSLGEVECPDESNWLTRRSLVHFVVLYVAPWPKGLKVPRELFPEQAGSIDAERRQLLTVMARFVELSERDGQRRGRHPAFGPLTLTTWKRLHALHLNHHLTQFGA